MSDGLVVTCSRLAYIFGIRVFYGCLQNLRCVFKQPTTLSGNYTIKPSTGMSELVYVFLPFF